MSLQVIVRLLHQPPEHLESQYTRYLQARHRYEPNHPSTGPIFKDSSEYLASDLIARAGLQGKKEGQPQIMERNANYIANLGGASAAEMGKLVVQASQRVYKQFGVSLVLNIDLQGEWNA